MPYNRSTATTSMSAIQLTPTNHGAEKVATFSATMCIAPYARFLQCSIRSDPNRFVNLLMFGNRCHVNHRAQCSIRSLLNTLCESPHGVGSRCRVTSHAQYSLRSILNTLCGSPHEVGSKRHVNHHFEPKHTYAISKASQKHRISSLAFVNTQSSVLAHEQMHIHVCLLTFAARRDSSHRVDIRSS